VFHPLAEAKYGLRTLLRDRVYTLTVLLTLAVCLAAHATTLAIVSSVLLRPLPVPDSHQLLLMSNRYPQAGAGDSNNSGAPDYFDRQRAVTALGGHAMFRSGSLTLGGDGAPEQIDTLQVTPTFFRVVGVPPAQGRAFTDAEGELGAEQKVILTHATWQRLFGGAPDVLGKSLRLSGRSYEVVGVMPRGFAFMDPDVKLIVPLAFRPDQKTAYHSNNWYNIGRLRPGATIEQAQAQVNALNAANVEKMPQFREVLANAGFYTAVERLQDVMVRDVRRILFLLWGGALFVLLIGALNVANLALVRFAMRGKEIATRLALGASRGQLIRQFVTENLLLTLGGAAAGLALGAGLLRGLALAGADRLPRAHEIHMDAVSVAASLGAALVIGVALGCLPLLGTLRGNIVSALHESARSATAGGAARNVRRGLVVAQVGCTFVLLLGAAMLLASFRALLHVDPGFRAAGVLTASTSAPRARYAEDAQLTTLMDRLLAAIRQLPGVQGAGLTSSIPFGGDYSDSVIFAEGYQVKPGESVVSPHALIVSPGYFETMGIGLLSGRFFDERDRNGSLPVVIVDQRLAKKFWGDTDPVGRRMFLPSSAEDVVRPGPNVKWLTVIGVVRPVRLQSLAGFGLTVGAYYFPFAQNPERGGTFAVRVAGDTAAMGPALRAAVAQVDPDLALFDVRTMQERSEISLAPRRTSLSLAVAFGGLAAFLSAIGIYGVLAYHVTQRQREFGIRLALGSTGGQVVRLVLREAVVVAAAGLLMGIGGAVGLRRLIENQVYGVQPLDPLLMGTVITAIASVVLAAAAFPARRATQVNPMVALRSE
jgi:predicted permease